MIGVEEMKSAVGKQVKVKMYDGEVSVGTCTEYLRPETEEEEHNISVLEEGYSVEFEITQKEIESIEILGEGQVKRNRTIKRLT